MASSLRCILGAGSSTECPISACPSRLLYETERLGTDLLAHDFAVHQRPLAGRLITEGAIQIADGHLQPQQTGPVGSYVPQVTLDTERQVRHGVGNRLSGEAKLAIAVGSAVVACVVVAVGLILLSAMAVVLLLGYLTDPHGDVTAIS